MKNLYLYRIILWSLERFPPVQIISSFLTFSIVCLPMASLNLGQPLAHGTWIVFSILLILRVLDEHKDYESDLIAHPERLLQRKILSLSDLRKLAYFFAITSLFIIGYYYFKLSVLVSLAVLLIWGFLMTKEFFVHQWLSERIFVYSVSHLIISIIIIYFCATLVGTEKNEHIVQMMLVSFFSAFSYEVARKIKGHDEVNRHEMNYVNSYGVTKPLILFVIVSSLAIFSSAQLIELTTIKTSLYIISMAYVVSSAVLFYKYPQKKLRKLNEAAAATIGLICFLVPLSKLIYG